MAFWSDAFPTQTTGDTTTSELPDWYQQSILGLLGKSAALADQPYPTYPGQRLAGFTPQQQQAFDMTGQMIGGYAPYLSRAGQLAEQSSVYDPSQLQKFLSPYIGGVVDEIGRLGLRNLTETALPQQLSTFTGGGQFGSTRSQDYAGRTIRDTLADIAGRQGTALQGAYDQAQKLYGDWAGRGFTGAGALGTIGQQLQRQQLADIGALSAAGGQQQQLGQQNLDWAYNQFQEQQQYPWQNVERLNALLRGINLPTSQTRTGMTAVPQESGWEQFTGALSQLGGLFR